LEQFKAEASKVRTLLIASIFVALFAREVIMLSQYRSFRRFGVFAPF
jgi:hypothetical protein